VRPFVVNLWMSLTLKNLTVADGYASDYGGAIYNVGKVEATNCAFSGNRVSSTTGIAAGGAIHLAGGGITELVVTNSFFSHNGADSSAGNASGGAIYSSDTLAKVTVSNSSFSGNFAVRGGAIYSGGTLDLSNSTFSDNLSSSGSVFSDGGSVTVTNSTFSNSIGWGGVSNDGGSVTVTNSTFSGTHAGTAVVHNSSGAVTLKNTIVANVRAAGCSGTITDGGGNLKYPSNSYCPGVYGDPKLGPLQDNGGPTQTMALGPGSAALDALDCAAAPVSDQRGVARPQGAKCDIGAYEAIMVTNSADSGPGSLRQALFDAPARAPILFAGDTDIQLDSDLVIYRDVTIDGSGRNVSISAKYAEVFSVQPGATLVLQGVTVANAKKSGIWNFGTVHAINCIFSGNRSTDFGGAIYNFPGGTLTVSTSTFSGNGGYYIGGGGIENRGTATVSNSTFSGNNTKFGGGIENFGALTVSNSTFSGNSAWAHGGGIWSSGTVTLKNTIVAGNTGGNCYGAIGGDHNLSDDGTCPGINGNPLLGPLQDNGGPTHTMALRGGSAALDAADDAVCAAAPVNNLDQRGVARPQGAHCDIGAYEAGPGVDIAGLKAHWKFDEGSGNATADSSGGGYTGELIGPAWTPMAAPTTFDNPYALHFDGVDDRVNVGGLTAWSPATVSVAAWIKADAWKLEYWRGVVVGKEDWSGGSHGFALRTGAGGRLSFSVAAGGAWDWPEVVTEPVMSTGEWHHIAGTYDGHKVRAYIDGIEMGVTDAEGAIRPSVFALVIGGDVYVQDRQFSGTIDDVRVYDGALSPEEVRNLATRRYRIDLPLVKR
jgi:predicted outer membrane repeat protein